MRLLSRKSDKALQHHFTCPTQLLILYSTSYLFDLCFDKVWISTPSDERAYRDVSVED